jgi:hypothetical protein
MPDLETQTASGLASSPRRPYGGPDRILEVIAAQWVTVWPEVVCGLLIQIGVIARFETMRDRILQVGVTLLLVVLGVERASAQNVTELYVTPDTIRLEPGQRQGLTVQAFDDAGNVSLAIRYYVQDSLVAQIASNGTVTAGRAGRTQILVQSGRKTKSVAVVVGPSPAATRTAIGSGVGGATAGIVHLVAEPATLQLLPSEAGRVRISALYADGTPAPGAVIHWRSLRTAIATVEDSSGTITGISTGQATIQALSVGGQPLDVPVTVALAGLAVDHDRVVLSPDESDTLAVVVPTQGRRRLRSGDLQWSVSDDAIAEITADGTIHALAVGRTEVVVHGFLQELRVPVIVHQRVARFAVAPRLSDTVRLPMSGSRDFTLIPQTADSVPIEGFPVTWTVGDTSVASFDAASGRLTARRPGATTLQFSGRGFLAKGWAIQVVPGAVAFARPNLAVRPGERTTLDPRFVDPAGQPVAPATGITWVTDNANAAKVAPDGTIEAVAPGRAVITAQAPGAEPARATVFVTGDLLVASTRGGRFGIYALQASQPESFFPLVADTFANNVDASYSPDRTRMVFASDRSGAGNYDIFVADADGRNPVRLTADPALDFQPVWTPDGQRVVFASARTGTRQLYVMRADGTELRQLTMLPGGAEEPALSPDGRAVAFTGFPAGRDGQSDILVVPIGGGAPVAATNTRDRRETRPVYLANGELAWVLLRRDKREPDQVQRQPPAGGLPATIVSSELSVVDVAFARDGSRMAWVASRPQEHNRNAIEFTFQWRSLASGTETSVRLLPGERITSPAF